MTRVDLVTGFLGAGKTTFIGRYIEYLRSEGTTFAVIENEFAGPGIDSHTLTEMGAVVREISGGCICCTLKVGLYDLMRQLAGQYDRIIVEPSGIFNCDDFMDILNALAGQQRLAPGMAVGIIDPAQMLRLSETELSVLASEIIPMGAILLSKTQQNNADTAKQAKERVISLLCEEIPQMRREEAAALIHDGAWDTLDFAALQQCTFAARAHTRSYANHAMLFRSTTLRPKEAYSEQRLRDILQTIEAEDNGDLIRMKGRVNSAEGGVFQVNYVSGTFDITHEPKSVGIAPRLSVIGRAVSRERLRALFAQ